MTEQWLTPECKKLQIYEIVSTLTAVKLVRRHADGGLQWNNVEECAAFLGEKGTDGQGVARPGDYRLFRGFVQALVNLIREKRELTFSSIFEHFGGSNRGGRPRAFFSRRLAAALKVLSLMGFARVSKNAKRQKTVTFVSAQAVRNSIYSFLQNARYTARADKKELKEKLGLIRLKHEAIKLIDKSAILKESGTIFKPRTPSFDLGAIDRFLQMNNNIVVPDTPIVLRPEALGGDSARN